MIAILRSMADSSAPTRSPIKSSKWSRDLDSPETVIPDWKGSMQPPRNQKHIRQRAPKPSAIDFLRWKPDEPNAKGHYKSWGNTQRTLHAHTVYNAGWDHIIPIVQFDREFQTNLDQNGRPANAELLMLMIKQQKKNLHVHVTANNEA